MADLRQAAPTPRLDGIDTDWARGVLEALEQERVDIVDDAGALHRQLSQVEYVMLAENCRDIGMLKYGLGYPLRESRAALAESAKAYLRVFELRGTQAAFEVTVVRGEESTPLHEPGSTDDSLTNSRRGLQALYVGLIARGQTLAQQIARHISDPPGAAYIGPDSEVCTPDDQQLAYAMKALLLENQRDALSQIRFRSLASPTAQSQAAVIEALITNRKAEFTASLNELLNWHGGQIDDPENQKDILLYFSIPGLALCGQALASALVERGELPEQDVFLPLDLLDDDAADLP